MIWDKKLQVKMALEKMWRIKMIWEKKLNEDKIPKEKIRKTKRTMPPANHLIKKTQLPIQPSPTPTPPILLTLKNQTQTTHKTRNKTTNLQKKQPTTQKIRTKHHKFHKLNKKN